MLKNTDTGHASSYTPRGQPNTLTGHQSYVTERDGMTTVLTPDPHALKSQEPFSETSIGGKVTLVRMLLVEVTVVVFELVLISVIFCSCSKIWAVALRCDSFLL